MQKESGGGVCNASYLETQADCKSDYGELVAFDPQECREMHKEWTWPWTLKGDFLSLWRHFQMEEYHVRFLQRQKKKRKEKEPL